MREFLTFARRVVRHRGRLVLALVFASVSAVNMGAGLAMLRPIIGLLVEDGASLPAMAEAHNANPDSSFRIPEALVAELPTERYEGVVVLIAIFGFLTALGATCNFLHQYCSITVATRAIAAAREELFRIAISMPLVRVSQRGASEFVARIIRDTTELHRGLIALMSRAVAGSLQAMVMFGVALWLGRSITLAAIVVIPVMAVFLRKVGKRIRRGTTGALAGQEELLRIATESVQGIRAIKANRGEAEMSSRFAATNVKVIREELRAQITRAFSSPFTEGLAFLLVAGMILIAAPKIISGDVDILRTTLALGALGIAANRLKSLSTLVNDLQSADATARRLLDVLSEPLEHDAPNTPPLPRHAKSIAFEAVRFQYPGADREALRDVDLRIGHGERVAIVGPNGSGKSTLLGLLPRLLEPTDGRILIDDLDVREHSLTSLRDQVSVVTQETVLFRGTIEDNIRLGCLDASVEAVRAAAKAARADTFIDALPNAYGTDVAEQGLSLSGGQRQRICIARAILRDPAILVLDEATSQVDSESEALIADALAAFCENRTSLVIAHRLATVLDADRIVVMDEGRIVDQGTHGELLDRCELYGRLSRTQLVAVDDA